MTAYYFAAATIWMAAVAILFGVLYRHTLQRLWREPLLRHPVLIIESDDWGPGPPADAEALQQLAQMLGRHRDARGRSAVMTLGMLLAVPDTARIRQANGHEYHAALISESQFAPIMAAIKRGMEAGVFSPQLHGMEHYWPEAVMKASRERQEIRKWLVQDGVPRNEDLPSALQSRWIDAAALPSQALPDEQVEASARSETEMFCRLFAMRNAVVVPPTFVWTEATEAAWSAAGVSVVVTPGTRYFARDGEGELIGGGGRLYNGQISPSGVTYMVRDDYFEPALGHRAERALAAMEEKTQAGRPTLLETHRFNFTGSLAQRENALHETESFLRSAIQRFPRIRFMSTAELASAMARSEPDVVELRLFPCIGAWLARAAQMPRLRQLAWVSGVILPAWLVYRALSLSFAK